MTTGLPFEVLCTQTRDRAYAATPEDALAAGRQLRRDARDHACGVQPEIIFLAYGKHVRTVKGAF